MAWTLILVLQSKCSLTQREHVRVRAGGGGGGGGEYLRQWPTFDEWPVRRCCPSMWGNKESHTEHSSAPAPAEIKEEGECGHY